MNAQEAIIHGIVKKRLYELLKPELIDYFCGDCSKLYEAIFMVKMHKLDPTIQHISNYIHTDSDVKNKPELIKYLNDICKGDRYIDPLSIEDTLEGEFYDREFTEIERAVKNPNYTLEMRKDIIRKLYNVINRTRKQADWSNLKELLQQHRAAYNEQKDDIFKQNTIPVTDGFLSEIIDTNLYPQPLGITARPGDFKTSLLLNIMLYLDSAGQPGIFLTLEDYALMVAVKAMSIKSGMDKGQILTHQYDTKTFDENMPKLGNNIYIMDRVRTPEEMYVDLNNKLSTGKFKWFAIDYLQQGKKSRYQSEYEMISEMDYNAFRLSKEHTVAAIRLSQVPADKTRSDAIIGVGDDKGSSVISQNSRLHISINPDKHLLGPRTEGVERRLVSRFKTTFCRRREMQVNFEASTGKVIGVYNV